MRTIKITINGTNKFKMKVASKKAKDIQIECREEYVNDTVALFKTPENLDLTEQNVSYLSGICETHKQVLNLKPIFLKRISILQSEIVCILQEKVAAESENVKVIPLKEPVSVLDEKLKEPVPEETVKESFSVPDEKLKEEEDIDEIISQLENRSECPEKSLTANENSGPENTQKVDMKTDEDIFSLLEDAEKMLAEEMNSFTAQNGFNQTTQYSMTTNPVDSTLPDLDVSMTTSVNDDALTALDITMTTLNDTIASLSDVDDTPTSTITLQGDNTLITMATKEDNRSITVTTDDDKTTRIKETRQLTVARTTTTYERDTDLFVKIISPKQRIVTRYKTYSPDVVTSPIIARDLEELRAY